jgi:tetratricopeptide (TPR) repeat protein
MVRKNALISLGRWVAGPLGFWLCLLGACSSEETGPDLKRARELVEEGRQAAKKGEHARAIDLYSQAVEVNPNFSEAFYERGNSEIQLRCQREADIEGRAYEERALADYSMAITKSPAFADAIFNRAMIYLSRAQYRPAAEELLKVIDLNKQDPEPHLILGQIYETRFEDRQVAANDHYELYVDLGGRDEAVKERVKLWKELKKRIPAASTKPPTPEDEKKAAELHENFKRLIGDGQRSEAIKALEELVSRYANTQYVQQHPEFKVVLGTLKK